MPWVVKVLIRGEESGSSGASVMSFMALDRLEGP
jgi:hypothetical protein